MSFNNEVKLYEPLLFTPAKPIKQSTLPFRDFNTPRARIAIGIKRSGKGVTMDIDVYKYWSAYFTCVLLHAAGGFENLYSIVNKNCQLKFETIKKILGVFVDKNESVITKQDVHENLVIDNKTLEMYLGLMKTSEFVNFDSDKIQIRRLGFDMYHGKLLHCNCRSSVPIIWMIPDWIKPKQNTFDWFNGLVFKTWEEYHEAYLNLHVHEYLPPQFFTDPNYKKKPIKKPDSLLKKIKPLIITRQFTTPITPSKVEIFRSQIRDIMLDARAEHRLLCHTPAAYPQTHQGKVEMYTTDAEFINYLPDLVQQDWAQLKLEKPRSEYTLKEKSWHKIALFLGEVRELAPSAKLSGDPESSVSKRALYNFMPKSRHQHCWVFMDLQAASDMFTGVRQQNDIRIVKRSMRDILGDEFGWFYDTIYKRREAIIESKGFTIRSVPYEILEEINSFLPAVDEIPDNKGYVLFPNNEYKLIKFPMSIWHHKSDRDDFFNDTGLEYTISKEKEVELTKESGKKAVKIDRKFSKKIQNDDWILMEQMKLKGMKWPEIIITMRRKDKENGIEVDRFEATDEIKNISNQYNRWKKRQKLN